VLNSYEKYMSVYRQQDIKSWEESRELEAIGAMLVCSMHRWNYVDAEIALNFVNRVEKWKAMNIPGRIYGVGVTTAQQAKDAVQNAVSGQNGKSQIESLHVLRGFGTSKPAGQTTRPAKVASAAMRFLFPCTWGVVDWRSATIVSCLNGGVNVEEAIKSAQRRDKTEWINDFQFIDAQWAVELNKKYAEIGRQLAIPRNAEVDQFLFGISLSVWPLEQQECCNTP
jgi:hypothetical protein